MIKIAIPGKGDLELKHVVFDVNGTLAVDGHLLPEIPELLDILKDHLEIHLLTADTHGKQAEIDLILNLKAERVKAGNEARQKADYIENLGAKNTVAIGQGANDALMLKSAGLGICTLSAEGTALETLLGSDLIVPDIQSALNILLNPTRLIASLRK
jgi:soluble P-type ATPase